MSQDSDRIKCLCKGIWDINKGMFVKENNSMQVFEYVIVYLENKEEYTDIVSQGRILAKNEEDCKIKVAFNVGVNGGLLEDKLILVRQFC